MVDNSNTGAIELNEYLEIPEDLTPSGDDVFTACAQHASLGDYLTSILRKRLFEIMSHSQGWIPNPESETVEQLLEITEQGKTLIVPANMCADLELAARHLDRSIMEWPLETLALPAARGFCSFATPIRIPGRGGNGTYELTALTWSRGYYTDLSNPATWLATNGALHITGLVKTPAWTYGEPEIRIDWILGVSCAENMRLFGSLNGCDYSEDKSATGALLRIFASLFQTAEPRAWTNIHFDIPEEMWSDADTCIGAEFGSESPEVLLALRQHFRFLAERFVEFYAFVPSACVSD
ncbi:MAG: hypothetical protein ABI670_09025 [Chloroflexota bacterium]